METNKIESINKLAELMNPMNSNVLQTIGITFTVLMIILLVSVILKGYSLWYSARNDQKWWFISILTINTLGILEIIYLLFYRDKKVTKTMSSTSQNEVKTDNNKNTEL